METVTLIIAMGTAFLAWAGWITVFVISTNAKANRSLTNDEVAAREIASIVQGFKEMTKELKDGFKEFAEEVKDSLKSTNSRLDIFVSNEITELKNMNKK